MLGKMIGESKETVKRAVERGWVAVRDDVVGKVKVRSGMLTEEGRRAARKSLRGYSKQSTIRTSQSLARRRP